MLSRWVLAVVAVSVIGGIHTPTFGQNLEKTFPQYMNTKKPGVPGSGDRVPLTRGNQQLYIPGEQIVTQNSAQTLTNKTIDCSLNNCVNIPGINWNDPVPTTCTGRPDGVLYWDGSAVTVCGATTVVTIGGVIVTMGGVYVTGL